MQPEHCLNFSNPSQSQLRTLYTTIILQYVQSYGQLLDPHKLDQYLQDNFNWEQGYQTETYLLNPTEPGPQIKRYGKEELRRRFEEAAKNGEEVNFVRCQVVGGMERVVRWWGEFKVDGVVSDYLVTMHFDRDYRIQKQVFVEKESSEILVKNAGSSKKN